MINVLASIQLKPGKRAEFLPICKANIPNVRAEKGCIEYAAAVDLDAGLDPQVLDEDMVTVIEKWESLDALNDHLGAPHMLSYRDQVKDLVDKVTLKVLQEA
jgi:quinol monooxygenase YgiN